MNKIKPKRLVRRGDGKFYMKDPHAKRPHYRFVEPLTMEYWGFDKQTQKQLSRITFRLIRFSNVKFDLPF